jgi:dephospho-CoA kinase
MKICLLGHCRHGKDTVAGMLQEMMGLTFESSSEAASKIFLYDALREKYGYTSPEQCFEDRVNHRAEWHDLICDYNKDDKARLAKEILKNADIYVGMRSDTEIKKCLEDGLFDMVIAVYDPRKPLEPASSFNIDMWAVADVVIPNAGTLEDLRNKLKRIM